VTDAIFPLARSFILGPGITGAWDVSVMNPSPCARLPHHHFSGRGESQFEKEKEEEMGDTFNLCERDI
jgi:hypothetical protein